MIVNRQGGISLVPALFLLIVLAALGIAAVRLTAVQQQTVVLAMQSARAFSAARSAAEWTAYQALNNASCTNATLAFTENGLAGFTAQTTCTSTSHTEGPTTVTVYVIEVFASAGTYGTPDYVSRRIRSTVTDAT